RPALFIEHPEIKPNEHYVKRLVGLPDESLSICEPYLEIDGIRLAGPAGIARIQDGTGGYCGFIESGSFLASAGNSVDLGADEFFACGDNQRSSLDSRYWGPVPRRNLVGPAYFVYWPFSARWGPAD
ncbi:signal peptidase I, partial [Verrucomicrobiota bacterium]